MAKNFMERGLRLEVPKKIFRRRPARLAIIFVHTAFARNLSWSIYIFDVGLHERDDRRRADNFGDVYGLAVEFKDGGRGDVNLIYLGDNRRAEGAFAPVHWNNCVADIFNAIHVAISILSGVSRDVWNGGRARTTRRHFIGIYDVDSGLRNNLAVFSRADINFDLHSDIESIFVDKNVSIAGF